MDRLAGKVAIVTGGGWGIARGCCRLFAAEGAAVAVADIDAERAENVAREIAREGGRAVAVTTDVNSRAQVEALVAATVAQFGPPDVLVNCAQGGGRGKGLRPLETLVDEDFLEAFQGGPLATIYGMQAVFPHMKERGGSIVNFVSQVGILGDPGMSAYGISKEAIRGLTRHAAREWGSYDITVNAVAPTALGEQTIRFGEEHPERYARYLSDIPLGRYGDPDADIAPGVLALVTDLRYMTGATVVLGGGRTVLR